MPLSFVHPKYTMRKFCHDHTIKALRMGREQKKSDSFLNRLERTGEQPASETLVIYISARLFPGGRQTKTGNGKIFNIRSLTAVKQKNLYLSHLIYI